MTVVNAQEQFLNDIDVFYKTYVSDGKIDYKGIKNNPEDLTGLINTIEQMNLNISDAQIVKAFWINAYNILTIKGIVDNYPVKSPLDIPGFFDNKTYKVSGESLTLNTIENDILRKNFKDARLHFVLVCGAIGCPPIINEAYRPIHLDQQLDRQTQLALNGDFLKINTKKKRVEFSEIMKWYKEDFVMDGKTEINFINIYRTDKIPSNFEITYFPYNWSLNSL